MEDTLDLGDYQTGNYLFERKTCKDFRQSRFDNRIKRQGEALAKVREEQGVKVFYIVEGDFNKEIPRKYLNWSLINATMNYIEFELEIPIIRTFSDVETGYRLISIACAVNDGEVRLKVTRKSFNQQWSLEQKQRYLLHSFYGIGDKTIDWILEEYNGIIMDFFHFLVLQDGKSLPARYREIKEILEGKKIDG